jgi:hypothetical protein
MFHSGTLGIEVCLPDVYPWHLSNMMKAGLLSELERKTIDTERERFIASPTPLVVRILLVASGGKP